MVWVYWGRRKVLPVFILRQDSMMDSEKGSRGPTVAYSSGWQMRCHQCGEILPLLHPHIVAERYDEDENMICECCFERRLSES